jgi:DNA polymerase-4/DNA polymerase V
MRSYFRQAYPDIARAIQIAIHQELDLTVSVGLAPTKSIAKIASDFKKPNGLTVVPANKLHLFLPKIPLQDVWGLGKNRVALLEKFGVKTAWDYVHRDERWIRKMLHKPGVEMWHELRGTAIMPLEQESQRPKASISKTKTFTAPSADMDYVYARLLRNIESACIKLRRHHLLALEISISLRTKDYRERAIGSKLNRPVQHIIPLLPVIRTLFEHIYVANETYRATGVVLTGLSDDRQYQYDLFEDPVRIEKTRELGQTIDSIQRRFGKHTVCQATGLYMATVQTNDRDTPAWRKINLLPGETNRKRIRLPMLEISV